MTENPLGYEKISKLLKNFAVPSIVASLVGSIYNIVDQIFMIKQVFSSIPGQVLDFMVVLIGLTIVFKKQINTLLENIFKQINTKTKEVY